MASRSRVARAGGIHLAPLGRRDREQKKSVEVSGKTDAQNLGNAPQIARSSLETRPSEILVHSYDLSPTLSNHGEAYIFTGGALVAPSDANLPSLTTTQSPHASFTAWNLLRIRITWTESTGSARSGRARRSRKTSRTGESPHYCSPPADSFYCWRSPSPPAAPGTARGNEIAIRGPG